MAGVPLNPKHPERICWGCNQCCRADDMACGNGTVRTPHPVEVLGEGWVERAQSDGITIDRASAREKPTSE